MLPYSIQEAIDDVLPSPAERYELLGLADALSRPYDYLSSCKELALILRHAYAKLPKNVQSLVVRDTLSAFRLLSNVQQTIGIPAANLLVKAAEAALPKQKKTLVFSEFKHAVVAQRRHAKTDQQEVYFLGYTHLPQDILLHIFRLLDLSSLVNASSVCWAWNTAAKEKRLWMSHYSNLFGKLDISVVKKSGYHADDSDDTVIVKEDNSALINIDWREAFKRKFIGHSAWRSKPHRAVCRHCESIILLNKITCDRPHSCCKSEQGRLKLKPISAHMLVNYLLVDMNDNCKSGENTYFSFSSSESDDSGCDESSSPKLFSKLWALPRLS